MWFHLEVVKPHEHIGTSFGGDRVELSLGKMESFIEEEVRAQCAENNDMYICRGYGRVKTFLSVTGMVTCPGCRESV